MKYDIAKVRQSSIDLGDNNWELCFSSDLPRAVQTAQSIVNCKIVTTDCLREVPISPIFNTNMRIPLPLWLGLGRVGWFFSHQSQPETRIRTIKRINDFITHILSLKESNILLVTHGFLMGQIQRELLDKGFRGEKFVKAKNGTPYVFQK